MRISAAETVVMSENWSPWRRARVLKQALGTTHRRGEEGRRMTPWHEWDSEREHEGVR